MAREHHLAIKGSVAALHQLQLDCAKGFVWVVVCDEDSSQHLTALI
jgi:hypothetical protein